MNWLEDMDKVSQSPMLSVAILPVILCGGPGTRLWPVSRENMPKQFARLVDAVESMFQATARRVSDLATFARPAVIASAESRFIVAEQLAQAGMSADIILEPEGRETRPPPWRWRWRPCTRPASPRRRWC